MQFKNAQILLISNSLHFLKNSVQDPHPDPYQYVTDPEHSVEKSFNVVHPLSYTE
jgi:hypothetical protein